MNDHDLQPPSLFMKKALAEIKLMCSFPECGKVVPYDLFQYHKDWGYCEYLFYCTSFRRIGQSTKLQNKLFAKRSPQSLNKNRPLSY